MNASLIDRKRYWTREVILQALLRFHDEYQRWPETYDFHPQNRVEYLPHICTVWRTLGGLDIACHAAEISSVGP